MRREWSGWIRTRQWGEFEKLAKADPCQALADTVAELELGFPDKPDRRALRKVLFLLSQAGYVPSEIDDQNQESVAPTPLAIAFFLSPDISGESVVSLGREERGRVEWLRAHMTYREGITRALEDTTPLDEAPGRLNRMRNVATGPMVSADVPWEFALAKLARGVAASKSLPPAMAYWRAILPKEIPSSHPTEAIPRVGASMNDLAELVLGPQAIIPWRLELGSLRPALLELMDVQSRQQLPSLDQDSKSWDKVIEISRAQLFSAEVVEDHKTRLHDLAYLMHLKQDPNYANVVAAADELAEQGPESSYARAITTKTLLLLVHTLQEKNATGRAEQQGGSQP